MGRKVFIVTWMIVWPAAALIPPFLTAQAPKPAVAVAKVPSVVVAPPVPEAAPEPAPQFQDNRIAARDTGAAQLTIPAPSVEEALKFESTGPHDPFSRTASTETGSPETGTDTTAEEYLPPAPGQPVVPRRRSTPVDRAHLDLDAQELHAQKLIHERAHLRAQQRNTRLEVKYHRASGIVPLTPIARWHLQLTQPNWVAGSQPPRQP